MNIKSLIRFLAPYAVLCFGLGLAIVGVWIAIRPQRVTTRTLKATIEQKHRIGFGGDFCTEPFQFIQSKLKFDISHPEKVYVGETFILHVNIRVTEAKVQNTYDACTDSRIDANLGEAKDIGKVTNLMKSRELGFVLNLAGAEVKPEGIVSAPDLTLKWSVHLTSVGKLSGYVMPTPTASNNELAAHEIGYHIFTADDDTFTLDVDDRFWTRDRVLSALTAFGGTLLTVPGFMAFIQDRKRRKEEGKKGSSRSQG